MILPIHGGVGGGGGGGHRLVGTWPCDCDTYNQYDCSQYGYTLVMDIIMHTTAIAIKTLLTLS